MVHHRLRDALVAAVVVSLAAVGWSLGHGRQQAVAASPHLVGTEEYLPGVAADVYLPAGPRAVRTPVVVLVPGGAWLTADRTGLAPLAEALAADGIMAVNATYRTGADGVVFPTPVQDVVCAVDFAAARARRAGLTPGPVVVVGHSSGGQVAALAALAGTRLAGTCPYPSVVVDGLVGLAGAYDIGTLSELAYPLFGATEAERPDLWRQGDPATWVGERLGPRPLAVLLAHGDADDQLSTTYTTAFADQLRRAGHAVRTVIVPRADHASIYSAEVIEGTIRDWVPALPAR